ncbi:MAG: methyltransferase domain-containing protein [Pseudomonadota bacterium]
MQFGTIVAFYDTHPINEQQIIEKLRADGESLAELSEDVLQRYDQDHYGGIGANDQLAALAGIDSDCHVLDVCSGMGGPARYLAHNYGCRVTGIDLTQSRVDGAQRLTEMAGLDDRIAFRQGNALDLPFGDGSFDVVISQEGFCHIPNKDRLVAECVRMLKPDGRLAFTDILATEKTGQETRDRLLRDMNFPELVSVDDYRAKLDREGCVVEEQSLDDEWRTILSERLAMYRGLKDQTVSQFGADHFAKWDRAYSFFVGLYETGELGGGRFLARPKAN